MYKRQHILILGLLISLGLADWGSRNYPSFNFYALPTRGWELIAGSLLAYFEINQGKRSQNQILNQILPVLGLFLIVHSIIFFNDSMFHPSLYTISPIIGVCLIIWFTNKEDDLITQILSFKPIVAIGLVSYSLYMWHYPIFAFARIKETKQTPYDKFELIVLTLILSIISFYLIEKPARNKNKSFKFLISFIIAAILIITTFSLFVIKTNGVQKRIPEIIKKNIKVQMEWNVLKDENGNYCYDRIRGCVFNKKNNNNIVLVGDSHAGSISDQLKKKSIENNYGFVTSLKKGCNFILNLNRVKKNKLRSEIQCDEKMQNQRLKFINEFDSSIVVLLGRLPLVLEEDRFNKLEGAYEGEMFDFLQNKDNSLNTKEERKLAIYESNDPSAVGPTMIWLIPESGNESTKYTWLDGAGPYSVDSPPDNDADRYLFMSAGNIFHDEIQSTGYGHYLYSVGPFQPQAGDTLHYTISQIYGVHMTGVEKNYQALKKIVEQNYRTPSPPPKPPLKVSVSSHQVNLNWEIGVDDKNPEKTLQNKCFNCLLYTSPSPRD